MKITFEGQSLYEIFDQMKYVLQVDHRIAALTPLISADAAVAVALKARPPEKELVDKPVNKPVDLSRIPQGAVGVRPVEKPVEKPKRERTAKQLENDAKLRARAAEKKAAGTMFKKETKAAPPVEPVQDAPEATPFEAPEAIDPAEMVKIRLKTIEELQAAYANGHQKEVFELLSRFGNGAKSFRELPPESFMPIRRAIDLGALE